MPSINMEACFELAVQQLPPAPRLPNPPLPAITVPFITPSAMLLESLQHLAIRTCGGSPWHTPAHNDWGCHLGPDPLSGDRLLLLLINPVRRLAGPVAPHTGLVHPPLFAFIVGLASRQGSRHGVLC